MGWQIVGEIFEMAKNVAKDENVNSNVKKASFSNGIKDIRIVLTIFFSKYHSLWSIDDASMSFYKTNSKLQ